MKHIPVRAAWLTRFPQLKLIGFQHVICNSTVDHLRFDSRGLLLQQAERIPSGIHLIECEGARFRIVFHQKSHRKPGLVPVATVLGSQLEKIQLLGPHRLTDNLESTYDVSKQSCVRVDQAPGTVQFIPVWEQLHGFAHYEVHNSEKDEHAFTQLTVLTSDRKVTISTFRCQLYEGGICHSKLWLFSHIRKYEQPLQTHHDCCALTGQLMFLFSNGGHF
ncbi:hypothetical protein P879_03483 [Paragonimus westermani]|uniref:Uncharacterized protein n=1 Tax=Paragonimus westermani TaxID=34504 RepID=A0A8T0DJK6_9TREM|nr:hypothetical protein P879_03483 [Paragonimus westermani]